MTTAKKLPTFIIDAVLWCLLCILLIFSFNNARAVSDFHSPISMRYNKPISGQAAYNARLYSIERSNERPFWPTFWREDNATFTSEHSSVKADYIAYSGESALVFPAKFIYGTAPSVTDNLGCAISSELAQQLWGNADAVGYTVEVGESERTIRGVFDDKRALALLSYKDEDTSQNWNVVELSGGSPNATISDAEKYAAASGLGKPNSIMLGDTPTFLAQFMAYLPIIILSTYAIALIIGFLKKRFTLAHKLALFAIIIAIALMLPRMLDALPAWAIPTRWSDLTFWQSLITNASNSLKEFFSMAPPLRDVDGKMLLLKQAAISFIAACLSIIAACRWHITQRQ